MSVYVFEQGLKLRQKVRAVVTDRRGRVLLIRPHGYSSDNWTFAGGGVERGENADKAVRRELREELGLTRVKVRRLSVHNRFVYSDEYKRKRSPDHDGQSAVMFACEVPDGVFMKLQAEEIAEARWFAPDAALEAFPVPKQRSIFEACIAEMRQGTADRQLS